MPRERIDRPDVALTSRNDRSRRRLRFVSVTSVKSCQEGKTTFLILFLHLAQVNIMFANDRSCVRVRLLLRSSALQVLGRAARLFRQPKGTISILYELFDMIPCIVRLKAIIILGSPP